MRNIGTSAFKIQVYRYIINFSIGAMKVPRRFPVGPGRLNFQRSLTLIRLGFLKVVFSGKGDVNLTSAFTF